MDLMNVSLYLKKGTSDKEYHLQLVAEGPLFMVLAQNGRRGGTLISRKKTPEPVDYASALAVYQATLKEKLKEGYTEATTGVAFTGTSTEGEVSGVDVQLLNVISEAEAQVLLADPRWGLQDKADGHRRAVQVKAGVARGINRRGLWTGLPSEVAQALPLNGDAVFDGELVGARLVIFDVLEYAGRDLRALPLEERLQQLLVLGLPVGDVHNGHAVCVAKTETTQEGKRALYARTKEAGREGVVFKLLSAPYSAGRPASGGPALKRVFLRRASVVVVKPNATKRSVQMGAYDEAGKLVAVGNCTIPPNADMPTAGAVMEVDYRHAYRGGALFQPRYVFLRDDIPASNCLMSQLLFKDVEAGEDDE